MYLFITFITCIYGYCFPQQIANQTNTPTCRISARETSGCTLYSAGLENFTIGCGSLGQYNLLPSQFGGNNITSVNEALNEFLDNYSTSPNCTTVRSTEYILLCNSLINYTQLVCVFKIPPSDKYLPACSSGFIICPSFLIILIIMFWL
jgi:hypothetical protein